jgi:hypothetical protein
MEHSIRSAPLWLQITVVAIVVVALLSAGPFSGWVILRRRRAEGPTAVREYNTGESWPTGWWAEPQKFGALDVTFAGQPNHTAKPGKKDDETDPPERPEHPEPTKEIPVVRPLTPPVVPDPERPVLLLLEQTQEICIADIWDAEVLEEMDEAERLFRNDPLGSWVLPPIEEYDYLPEADKTFRDLVARNWMTGEGADVTAEWEPWKLEEVYA